MKIIRPCSENSMEFISLDKPYMKNSIFLAGPCPRENYEDDWRYEAIEILEELGFDGTVLNPTNDNYMEMRNQHEDMLMKQTTWEYEAMNKATAIVFWIPRSKEHPAFTTNIELGQWWGKKGVYVGFPNDSWKNEYIDCRLKLMESDRFDNLYDLLTKVVLDLNNGTKDWFTSDTHFGAERTLNLSKRPFVNTWDMDLTLISNWNKNIHKNDIVYFLGDFGNFDVLDVLNFKKLYFVYGNYETKELDKVNAELSKYKNVECVFNDELKYISPKGYEYVLRHEVINPNCENYNEDLFYAFGHIHGRNQYKRNGIDVGIDANNYTPIDSDLLDWMHDAVCKYVDENVFTDVCK